MRISCYVSPLKTLVFFELQITIHHSKRVKNFLASIFAISKQMMAQNSGNKRKWVAGLKNFILEIPLLWVITTMMDDTFYCSNFNPSDAALYLIYINSISF